MNDLLLTVSIVRHRAIKIGLKNVVSFHWVRLVHCPKRFSSKTKKYQASGWDLFHLFCTAYTLLQNVIGWNRSESVKIKMFCLPMIFSFRMLRTLVMLIFPLPYPVDWCIPIFFQDVFNTCWTSRLFSLLGLLTNWASHFYVFAPGLFLKFLVNFTF